MTHSVMKVAHLNALYGVEHFGGLKADYFAEALRLAHNGVNLYAEKAAKQAHQAKNKNFVKVIALIVLMLLIGVLFGSTMAQLAAHIDYVNNQMISLGVFVTSIAVTGFTVIISKIFKLIS